MIRKVVQARPLDGLSEIRQNVEYWLGRPPEERVAAVEEPRREVFGDSHRLQRVVRVMIVEEFTASKKATGRAKDAADVGEQ
jgi:hypothetical protein